MSQIVPYLLWIGHAGDGRDFKLIFDSNIQAIFYLAAEEPLPQVPRELICFRFPLLDGAGNCGDLLFLAVSTLAGLIRLGVPTLVTCGAGLNRSPALTAAAISLFEKRPPEECLAAVRKQHPCDVSPGLWSEVVGVLSQHKKAKDP